MTYEELHSLLKEKVSISRYALRNFSRDKSVIEFIRKYTEFLPLNSPLNIRCWHIINKNEKVQICKTCKINHTRFNNNKWDYLDYCSVKCQRNSPIVIKRLADSLEKKYGKGIANCFQSTEIKEKIKQTYIEKYGVDHNFKIPEFKEKYRSSMQNRYGVDHFSQTDEFKEKIKNTCISRYGVNHFMQDPIICDRILKNIHAFKNFTLPSGKIVRVQGFENIALDILLKEGFEEKDILISKGDISEHIGKIQYTFKSKEKVYFPDFFIKSINTIIEVKSTWTYNRNEKMSNEDNVFFAKEARCKELGFNFRLMIIDKM